MNPENLNYNERRHEENRALLTNEDIKNLGLNALNQDSELNFKLNQTNEPAIETTLAEREKTEPKPITQAMTDYLLATGMISDMKDGDFSEFIDKNDLRLLKKEESELSDNGSQSVKNGLEQIYRRTIDRRRDAIRPNMPLEKNDLKQLKYDLKKNHVLDLGEILKAHLDDKDVTNKRKADILIWEELQVALGRLKPFLEKTGRYNDEFAKARLSDLTNLFNGMRHEAAFEEMIYEGNSTEADNLFDIEETDYDDELHGIDMRIIAKVLTDENGKYYFPSTPEEFERSDAVAKIDVDIKASENAVENALFARKKFNFDKKGQPLILWSHVYNDDFRLDLSEGFPTLGYSRDEALLYLKYGSNHDGQIDAMKRIHESPDLKYHNDIGTYSHPDNFDERYAKIKAKLINYINEGNATIETT